MALIDCPECGHQVSDAADTCPSCGLRLKEPPAQAQLQLHLELSQIDLEWERARARLVMHTKFGQEYVPSKWSAVATAVVALIAGIAIGIKIGSLDPVQNPAAPGIAVLLGGLIVVVGLGVSLWYYAKAEAYENAEAEYRRKKEAALAKYEGQSEMQTSQE